MAVITEEAARRLTADGRREVRLAAEDIVTPAAKTYFQEKRVTLSTDQAPSEAMEDRYTTVFGAVLSEKPEHMTHLRGNLLVFKDHPRIILRGKIDSLESAIILVQAKALEAGDSALSAELEEVITFIRHLLQLRGLRRASGRIPAFGLGCAGAQRPVASSQQIFRYPAFFAGRAVWADGRRAQPTAHHDPRDGAGRLSGLQGPARRNGPGGYHPGFQSAVVAVLDHDVQGGGRSSKFRVRREQYGTAG